MRVQLHQADGQTVGVRIVLVVSRHALPAEFRRPGLQWQTVLERRADIKKLEQSGNAYADAGRSGPSGNRGPGPRIGAVDKPPDAGKIRFTIRCSRGGPGQVRFPVSGLWNSRGGISRPLREE